MCDFRLNGMHLVQFLSQVCHTSGMCDYLALARYVGHLAWFYHAHVVECSHCQIVRYLVVAYGSCSFA